MNKSNPVVWPAIREPFSVVERKNQEPRLAIKFFETDGGAQPRALELSPKDVERLVQFIRQHPAEFATLTVPVTISVAQEVTQ